MKNTKQMFREQARMFSVLTAITITVGSVSSTMVLNEQERLAAEAARPSTVELAEPRLHQPSNSDPVSSLRYL